MRPSAAPNISQGDVPGDALGFFGRSSISSSTSYPRDFKKFFVRMGFLRYMVFSNLVLMMAALPLKMVARWAVNLKYFIAIPEWFFNV